MGVGPFFAQLCRLWCCASEAATERVFSSEAIVHSDLRNRMDPDTARAIMKVRWNFEKLAIYSARNRLALAHSQMLDVNMPPDSEESEKEDAD